MTKVLILAGGSGTRLWPLSTSERPKQFCAFFSSETLFQKTLCRAKQLACEEDILVVASKEHEKMIQQELPKGVNVLFETQKKNTLGAICQGIKQLTEEVIIVLSSDHYMENEEGFFDACARAKEKAKSGYFCVFGKKPTKAHTGYGYIQVSGQEGKDYFVSAFVEKPNEALAKKYVEDDAFYWNLGMFCFLKSTFVHKLKVHQKSWYDFVMNQTAELGPSISVDYGILEKVSGIFMVTMDEVTWSDVGSFDAIWELSKKDNEQNVSNKEVVLKDSKRNFIHVEDLDLHLIDMQDLIVVQKENKLLICPLKSAQKVKEILAPS